MTQKELIAAVNKLKIPLKQVAQETSIPLSALNKCWGNKKELGLMEFDILVKWVVGKNNEPDRKEDIMKRRDGPIDLSYKIYDKPLEPEDMWVKNEKMERDGGLLSIANPVSGLSESEEARQLALLEEVKENRFYREPGLSIAPDWMKKIEDFCYENKITPEDLIIGYIPPKVRPIPRSHQP